jgi:hypothetical protein
MGEKHKSISAGAMQVKKRPNTVNIEEKLDIISRQQER